MIAPETAMTLVGFGILAALFCVIVGVVIHNRWLDRRLAPKKLPPKALP